MSIYASMRYRDAAAAIEWLEQAFGFKRHLVYEDGGVVSHAELRHGDGLVMLGQYRGTDDHRLPGQGWAYVAVSGIEAHHAAAVAAGASIVTEVADQGYGWFYSARDPEGNLWSFGTYAPSLAPEAAV